MLVKMFCCSDLASSCKISSCSKLFSDIDHYLSSWPTSFGNFPSYSHYFNESHSEMDTVLRIYNICKAQLDYCLLISGHCKKLSAYYALNIMPDTVYVFSFILTNILWDRHYCYSHLIRSCPGYRTVNDSRTETQMSLCFKSSINMISKL